ncbi:MAG: PqqD family protein [Ruminococcaceae bacterium]|nr:PqqD family protein [Oscillospiraceae bacterium]
MKIKKDFMLRNVAGYYVVVPVGDGALNFNGVINLNESGAFLWKTMENDVTEADMVAALLGEYDVDEDRAKADVAAFVKKVSEANLVEE